MVNFSKVYMLNKSVVTFATHNTQINCGCNCQLNAVLLLQGKAGPIKTIEMKTVHSVYLD